MQNPLHYAEALAHKVLSQDPETITRDGRASFGQRGVDEVSPPEDLADEYELYETTPFIEAALNQYAADVLDPGYRVIADSGETANWFNDEFLPQAGIVGGQRHQDFGGVLEQAVIQYLAAGNIIVENVKNDSDEITGFLHINPASVTLETEPKKPILVDPEADSEDWFDGELTARDEAAAFVQYDDQSVLGLRGRFEGRDDIPLSQNDVTFRPRSPPAGEIWGRPITRAIADEVSEFKQILRDNAKAIQSKAWGIWSLAFQTEAVEAGDEVIVTEWSEDDQDDFVDSVGSMEPGDLIGHDGSIDFERFEGEVPDEILDVLEAYVKIIVTALPTPLYAVGFESNINQFVVKQQEQIYDNHVANMRRVLEETFQPALEQAAEDHGHSTEGLELKIEPEEDESPIRSLEVDDIEKFALYMDGLKSVFGKNAARAFEPEDFADLILQLPEDAIKEEAFLGVPGGDGPSVEELAMLDPSDKPGKNADRDPLSELRSKIQAAKQGGDAPSVGFPTSGGKQDGNVFGKDDSEDENERDGDGQFS